MGTQNHPTGKLLRVGFFRDRHFYVRGDLAMQANGHKKFAERFQRFFQMHLAAIDREALRFQRLRDIRTSDGTEQMIAVAGLALEAEFDLVQLLHQLFGVGLFLGGAPNRGVLHLLDDGLVSGRGFDRQVPGQQKIATVALGNFDDISTMAEVLDVFLQNDFHVSTLQIILWTPQSDCAEQRAERLH